MNEEDVHFMQKEFMDILATLRHYVWENEDKFYKDVEEKYEITLLCECKYNDGAGDGEEIYKSILCNG